MVSVRSQLIHFSETHISTELLAPFSGYFKGLQHDINTPWVLDGADDPKVLGSVCHLRSEIFEKMGVGHSR